MSIGRYLGADCTCTRRLAQEIVAIVLHREARTLIRAKLTATDDVVSSVLVMLSCPLAVSSAVVKIIDNREPKAPQLGRSNARIVI